MPGFILVHGAWFGGWCYRYAANKLRRRGHVVVTPTLTGVGERFHATSEAITLETHIRDVVGCIEAEELDRVVLCGHSYGGMVITGVADRMAERIKTLVYLDAFVPEHGDSCNGLLPKALAPEVAQQFLEGFRGMARERHSGMVTPLPAEMFNVTPERRDWVNRRCVPQPLATFEMPILLSVEPTHALCCQHAQAEGDFADVRQAAAAKMAGASPPRSSSPTAAVPIGQVLQPEAAMFPLALEHEA